MKRKAKGSLTVEAAIVVPIVIIIMIPFLYMLRSLYVYDCVRTAVFETAQMLECILYASEYLNEEKPDVMPADDHLQEDTAAKMADYGEFMDVLSDFTEANGGVVENVVWQQIVRYFVYEMTKEQNLAAWGLDRNLSGVSFLKSRFMYEDEGKNAVFCIVAEYSLEIPFVSRMLSRNHVQIQCIGRAYVGKTTNASEINQDRLQQEENWYRIGEGNHYHTSECYLIAKETTRITILDAKEQGYKQCRVCKTEDAIVVVTIGGERYHREGCRYILPHLTKITNEEIQNNGYDPCEICIGGGTWFQ